MLETPGRTDRNRSFCLLCLPVLFFLAFWPSGEYLSSGIEWLQESRITNGLRIWKAQQQLGARSTVGFSGRGLNCRAYSLFTCGSRRQASVFAAYTQRTWPNPKLQESPFLSLDQRQQLLGSLTFDALNRFEDVGDVAQPHSKKRSPDGSAVV